MHNFILENDQISTDAKLTYTMLQKYAREMDECFLQSRTDWQKIWAQLIKASTITLKK